MEKSKTLFEPVLVRCASILACSVAPKLVVGSMPYDLYVLVFPYQLVIVVASREICAHNVGVRRQSSRVRSSVFFMALYGWFLVSGFGFFGLVFRFGFFVSGFWCG